MTANLHSKFILLFGIMMITITGSFLIIGNQVYKLHLRREAVTVVHQVIAFRRWVANTGGVWVNGLHRDFKDYLFKKEFGGAEGDVFYAKNPALATREFSTIYSKLTIGTTFRVTSENFRKSENKPDAFEQKAIQMFKNDKNLSQIESFEGNDYRYAQPLKIEKSCLKCHGKPEDAPKELKKIYGDKKAFGYKVGDIRGLISVQIPRMDFLSIMNPFEWGAMILSVLAIAGTMLLNVVWFRRLVSQPLNKLTEATKEIAKGDFSKRVRINRQSTNPASKDEIKRLGIAFNNMIDALQKTTVSLDYVDNIITSMADMLIVVNPDATIKTINQATSDHLGYEEQELIGKSIWDIFEEKQGMFNVIETENLVRKKFVESIETIYIAKNGDRIFVSFSSAAMRDKDDQIQGIVCVAQDITERKKLEEALIKSENLYRLVTDTATSSIITMDESSTILFVNHATEKMFGYTQEEMVGQEITILMPENLRHHYMSSIKKYLVTGKKHISWEATEIHGLHKKGNEFPLEISFGEMLKDNKRFFTGIVHDITGRKQMENHLLQSQKMEALGTLAGGIAHDFNNILGAILGNAEMCMMDLAEDRKEKVYIENITNAGHRATNLVKQILTFSRMESAQIQSVNLIDILQESLKMVRATIPTNVEIRQDIQKDCGNIMADATQINQIILNLCTNAYQAVEEKGGRLKISLKQFEKPPQSVDLGDGPCLMLSVKDNGCGISTEVKEKIFDPFFTTKGIGEGTGLGLAVVHGIIKNHKGKIRIESEVDKGTTVKIFFPVIDDKEDMLAPIKTEAVKKGEGHILVVEDEPDLIGMYQHFLEQLGYTVTACRTGSDAFKIFKKNPEQFDLVFTDQAMPNMTGRQLCEKLLAIRPDTPIILATGYSSVFTKEEANAIGIRKYIMKPVKLTTLSHAIEESLK